MRINLSASVIESIEAQKINLYDSIENGLILRITKKDTESFCFRYTYNKTR